MKNSEGQARSCTEYHAILRSNHMARLALHQVGDDSGTVHCFEMKRGEAQTVFSFRFADSYESSGSSAGTGNMITAVVMGGTTGGAGGGDRIFATQV